MSLIYYFKFCLFLFFVFVDFFFLSFISVFKISMLSMYVFFYIELKFKEWVFMDKYFVGKL